MIRFATIGSGHIVEQFLTEAQKHPEFTLTAVYSRTGERAAEFAARWEAPLTFTDLNQLAACGEAVNILYGTEMETAGDFIITTEGKPICYATSEAAKMHFARNDDGQGLERGKLTWAIAYSQRVRTGQNGRQQRFTEEEIELLERKWAHFLRQDVEVILFNEDFFAAAVPELKELADALHIKVRR